MTTAVHIDEHAHPGPVTYAKVAGILCLITFLEFGVFYTESIQFILVPLLTIMSVVKFILVAAFYMHLKFDHKVFSYILICGAVLSFSVFFTLLSLYVWAHPIVSIN